MATFRSISTLTAGSRSNSTFSKPPGLSVGDVMQLVFDIENDVAPTPPSTDWVLIDNIDHTSQANDLWAWWKIATQADVDATNFVVTHSSSWTNGFLVAIQSGSSNAPVISGIAAQGTGTTATANSVTTRSNNANVGFVVVTFGDMGAITPPTGSTPTFVERYESTNNIYYAEGTLTTAGATGTKSITFGASQAWIALMFVIEDTAYTWPFPWIASTSTKIGTSLGSANSQPLPFGSTATDFILALAVNDNTSSTALTGSTGWVPSTVVGTTAMKSRVFARVLDGTTGDNLFALSGAAQDFACIMVRLKNHGLTQTDLTQWVTDHISSVSAASGNADPPALDPPGAAKDYLWIAAGMVDMGASGDSISIDPTNYFTIAYVKSASSTSSVGIRAARSFLNATSENPGAFTNTSRAVHAWTIAIPPFVAGSPPTLPIVYLKSGGVFVQHSLKTKISGAFNS